MNGTVNPDVDDDGVVDGMGEDFVVEALQPSFHAVLPPFEGSAELLNKM